MNQPAYNITANDISNQGLFAQKELAKRYLHSFVKEFWSTIVEDDFIDNWHVKSLCEELELMFWRVVNGEDKEYDLIVNVPPGTTKSKIFSVMFPVWAILNAPWMSLITSSHTLSLALELADLSRDVIESDKFKRFYPNIIIREGHDSKSKYQIAYQVDGKWKNGGKRFSTAVGSSPTGLHGHMIIVDDPIDPKKADATNDINLKTANNYMDRTLSSRKVSKTITPIILIMQRLHQDDPTGHQLKKDKPLRHICLPGKMSDDPDINVLPKEWEEHYIDGLLDTHRLDTFALDIMLADLGQYGFAGQVFQCPKPPGGGMFKTDKFVILEQTPNDRYARQKVYYWDKAGTQDGGAYTVGVYMWEMKKEYIGPQWLIVKVVRGQWSSEARETIIKQEAEISGKRVSYVVEQEPGSGGKESAEATIKRLAGYKCSADRPTGDKVFRADPLSVQVNWGNVGIVNGPWLNDFIDELKYFPDSTYKDQTDAASGAFKKITNVKKVGAW